MAHAATEAVGVPRSGVHLQNVAIGDEIAAEGALAARRPVRRMRRPLMRLRWQRQRFRLREE